VKNELSSGVARSGHFNVTEGSAVVAAARTFAYYRPYIVRKLIFAGAHMPIATKRRDDRLEVRLSPKAKAMLKRAATVERKTVSAFILDKGLEAAAETLASRSEFRLTSAQYDAFAAALDSRKSRPRLEQLLTTPSVLE
jgi:uncharacterized protein (DUF1778 family)